MNGHHLVLGQLTDYLTGKTVADTHDERYRQHLARLLVERKRFARDEILSNRQLKVKAGEKAALVPLDFQVRLGDRVVMIIKYGPGSLVTRHRPALALGRLVEPYQIPRVVVTNGEDAHLLDGAGGKQLGSGLDAIPSRADMALLIDDITWPPIPASRAEMEARVLFAFEVDGCCPCDDTICRL